MATEVNIHEQIAAAEKAEETKVTLEPTEKEDFTQVGTSLTSAGYSYIYDTRTGERSKTNNNMLPAQLKKTRADGSLRFTTIKPKFAPKMGTLKCLLHADDPNRAYYNTLGLPVCKKHNLTSPFQRRRHMEKRHPMEWGTIEEERKNKEKQEDRDFQRGIINLARPQEKPPLYISKKDRGKTK